MYPEMSDNNPKSTIRHQIDENLKRIYDEALQEEIPDQLSTLLEQLRQKLAATDEGDERKKS